jgi:hypothetical protein
MSLLGSLVLLKEQVRKAELVAMLCDNDTLRLLDNIELSLITEINRISELERARGNNVGITEIDTYI